MPAPEPSGMRSLLQSLALSPWSFLKGRFFEDQKNMKTAKKSFRENQAGAARIRRFRTPARLLEKSPETPEVKTFAAR